MRASSVVRPTNAGPVGAEEADRKRGRRRSGTPSRSASASCCVSWDGPVRRRVTSRLRSSVYSARAAPRSPAASSRRISARWISSESGSSAACRRVSGDRSAQVAVPCGGGGELLEQRDEAVAVLVLRLERPLVVEPGKEGALAERERLFGVPGGAEALGLEDVDPGVGREADAVASRDERVLAERAAQRPERAAQARARAVVEHVGPESGGDGGPRLRARAEGQPAEQRARPSRRERTAFTVDLCGDLADESQPQHRQSVTAFVLTVH